MILFLGYSYIGCGKAITAMKIVSFISANYFNSLKCLTK